MEFLFFSYWHANKMLFRGIPVQNILKAMTAKNYHDLIWIADETNFQKVYTLLSDTLHRSRKVKYT